MSAPTIRAAGRDDAPRLLELIRGLARFEKLEHQVEATAERLAHEVGVPDAIAHALIAELDGKPAGFALYFFNFSTFLGRRGVYLEDLFVLPELRSHGIGRALLVELARIAQARGCGRLEWSVLDWNVDAQRFYSSIGAVPMDEWTVWRMDRKAIADLAR